MHQPLEIGDLVSVLASQYGGTLYARASAIEAYDVNILNSRAMSVLPVCSSCPDIDFLTVHAVRFCHDMLLFLSLQVAVQTGGAFHLDNSLLRFTNSDITNASVLVPSTIAADLEAGAVRAAFARIEFTSG
eukprot:4806346-Pleurochrysis_carterae.AAC.2